MTIVQIAHILALAARTTSVSPRDLLMTIAGFALASSVLVLLLAVPAGLEKTAALTGRPDVAMAISANAFDEATSTLTQQQFQLLGNLAPVLRDETGGALIAPQLIGLSRITSSGRNRYIQVRGVDHMTWKVMDIDDRDFDAIKSGGRGLLAGATAVLPQLIDGIEPRVKVRAGQWHVTDRIDHGGSLWDSEYWGDLSTLQADNRSPSEISVALIKMNAVSDLQRLREAAEADPRLREVRIIRQTDYYQLHTQWLAELIRRAAFVTAAILGATAALSIGNSLSAAFSGRVRQMATLRAIGFSGMAVALSALLEVIIIGLFTFVVAFVLIYLTFNGYEFTAASEGHQVVAKLSFGEDLFALALLYTIALAVSASVVPIWRMSFGNLVEALASD